MIYPTGVDNYCSDFKQGTCEMYATTLLYNSVQLVRWLNLIFANYCTRNIHFVLLCNSSIIFIFSMISDAALFGFCLIDSNSRRMDAKHPHI